MSELIFVIRSQNAVAKVTESNIRVINSRFFRGITIPFSIRFPRITDHNNFNGNLKGRWDSLEGTLNYSGIDEPLFFFQKNVNRDLWENYEVTTDLVFEFTSDKIQRIERLRSGDLELNFRAILFLEVQNDYRDGIVSLVSDQKKKPNGQVEFLTSVEQIHLDLKFKIPKSFWIETILSKIYKPFRLIQVPVPSSVEGEAALDELMKAEEYFLQSDYDKVVAHCTVALDPVRAKFKGLKEFIKAAKTMPDWEDGIKFSTLVWLDQQFRLMADVTNKSHHAEPRSFGQFSREDAEAIYLVTVGVISIGERTQAPELKEKKSKIK